MESSYVSSALGAFAQETRFGIFRLLVQAGAEGLAVGHLGGKLGLTSTTLSFHLNQLRRAGLVSPARNECSIIYMAKYASVTALVVASPSEGV